MPFHSPDVLPPDMRPDNRLVMPDGRVLVYVVNQTPNEVETAAVSDPHYVNQAANTLAIDAELVRLGVLSSPEVSALTLYGEEEPGARALYTDSRIGTEPVHRLYNWMDRFAELPRDALQTQRRFSRTEIHVLVTMAMDEMGISNVMEQIRLEEAAQPCDLNAILREAEEYEGHTPEPRSAQHLAPEDLIW